jgi:hypothetical protein
MDDGLAGQRPCWTTCADLQARVSAWALSSFSWLGRRVSLLRGAVLTTSNGTDLGEHKMSKATDRSEPASELEHLMADLPGLGQLVFVFGDDFAVTHLTATIKPVAGR